MAVTALAHVCILVTNIEKSSEFYCDILGMERLFDFTKNGECAGFYARINQHNFIEFFQEDVVGEVRSRMSHICLETENIESERENLMAKGVSCTEITKGCDNTLQFWFADPDGVPIEFHQYSPCSSQYTGKSVEMDW